MDNQGDCGPFKANQGDCGPIKAGVDVVYWDDWTDGDDMRAMWADPGVKLLWEQRREASGKVPFKMEKVGDKSVPYVGLEELQAAVLILLRRHFSGRGKRLWPTGLAGSEGDAVLTVCAVARVASGWQPFEYCFVPRLGEASTGLMQVLQSTAKWLAEDMGYRTYAADVSFSRLFRPFAALYYGMAHLTWLTTYKGVTQSEEFVVRANHGGPGGWEEGSAASHWSNYLQAKEEVLRMLRGSSALPLPPTPAATSVSPPILPSIPLQPALEAPPFPHEPPFPQQPPFPSAAQASFPSPLQSVFSPSNSERSAYFSVSVKWGFK